jgi:2-iminobutanoate/2-iminopropanoate deaminase
MSKRIISTDSAPAAVGPYSQAVDAGDLLFVSGQIGLDPATGELVAGGVEAQTSRALDNLGAILEAAGLGFGHLVKCTVLLADIGDFKAVNGIYAERFGSDPPARAAFAAAGLPLGALVEIEAIALKS